MIRRAERNQHLNPMPFYHLSSFRNEQPCLEPSSSVKRSFA